ncbi:Hypothetical protein NTJ_01339 [Nesidiocoris tenuis]|uniref:Uncharacterized protein n=1 Tax=Nesidiocoris tenuis TaxID=355587 RepID=A0ABN7A976_9HEMI|nr:Hypothetical protein NTJ_01339 [Nesidiocoris tenuis]
MSINFGPCQKMGKAKIPNCWMGSNASPNFDHPSHIAPLAPDSKDTPEPNWANHEEDLGLEDGAPLPFLSKREE